MIEVVLFAIGCMGGFFGTRAVLRALRRREIERWAAQRNPPRPLTLKERIAATEPEIKHGRDAAA